MGKQFDFEGFFSKDLDLEEFRQDIREQITGVKRKEKVPAAEDIHFTFVGGHKVSIVLDDTPIEIVSSVDGTGDSLMRETIQVMERITTMMGPAKALLPKFDLPDEETIYNPELEDFFNATTEDIKMCVNE